jgi:hypothetical protein
VRGRYVCVVEQEQEQAGATGRKGSRERTGHG